MLNSLDNVVLLHKTTSLPDHSSSCSSGAVWVWWPRRPRADLGRGQALMHSSGFDELGLSSPTSTETHLSCVLFRAPLKRGRNELAADSQQGVQLLDGNG